MIDLAIVGGGPAGLATAIRAAQAGFSAVVLERAPGIPDKACGEGLMPAGVRALRSLGALEGIPADQCRPFVGIRYVQEGGGILEARFSAGSGLGIRRTALSAALADRAQQLGASLRRCTVRGHRTLLDRVLVDTADGEIEARLLVAADGINSPLRRAAGLSRESTSAGPSAAGQRYGLRRHFACAPWSDFVEVHWERGVECYVTPVGGALVNVAFLWEDGALGASDQPGCAGPKNAKTGPPFDALLSRFPRVARELGCAPALSEARGAGPLLRRVRARAGDKLALVGDAAGYIDAITGQGLSLAFASAQLLIAALPRPLDSEALAAALRVYDRSLRSSWLRYALPARGLLALARRPRLRRRVFSLLQHTPRLFAALLDGVAGG